MAKASPPVSERKQPETFCLFGPSQVAFGLVVVEGNAPVGERKRRTSLAVLAQPPNEVVDRGLFDPPAGARTARTGLHRGLNPCRKRAALRAWRRLLER